MKKILRIFLFWLSLFWMATFQVSNAWDLDDIFKDEWSISNPYEDDKHGLKEGIETTKWIIDDSVTDRSASAYIQDVVAFLLWFIAIVAVILIIYAWFNILTWAWDEEKVKKAKMTIIYVVIGMIVIYLAWPIFTFIVNVLNWNPPVSEIEVSV